MLALLDAQRPKPMNETLRRVFKWLHYPIEVILVCVRWYVAYPPRLRHLKEMMTKRGGRSFDHSPVGHRVIKRVTRPILGFKTFRCARIIIAGIETMRMLRKDQLANIKDKTSLEANQCYPLEL